ncbi:MAG: rod shape-determining protein MreC [Asticcacaulis sp.]
MAYGDNKKHFEHLKLPVTWAVMGIVGFVCVGAALLFLGDKRESTYTNAYANRAVFDSVASVPDQVLSRPVQAVGDGTNWLDDYFFAVRENRILKKQLAELSRYRDLYTEEKDINTRYEKLLNLRTEPPVEMVTARSVSVSRGPFVNNRLIDAGADKGIAFGNPVITDQGLIGRIVGVSSGVSRVLMVTDVTSHVPVMVLRSDARAMMSGDGGGYPKLDFVRGKDSLKVGDQILSSGDGGVFPRGLPVGEAMKGLDGSWRVRLYANRSPIDFVKVLLFKDFSQLPNIDTILRTPPVSDVLPPPALPAVQTGTASSATSSSVTSDVKSSAAGAVSSSVSAKPVTARPATASSTSASSASSASSPKPVVPKPVTRPAGTQQAAPKAPAAKPAERTSERSASASSATASSSVAPVTPQLRPFTPTPADTAQ